MNQAFETEMSSNSHLQKKLPTETQDQKSLAKSYEEKKHVELQNKLIMSDADMKVDKWLSSYRP